MKKTMSRILCALLCVAMICAMIPAAMATDPGSLTVSSAQTIPYGTSATLTATTPTATAHEHFTANYAYSWNVGGLSVTGGSATSSSVSVTGAASSTPYSVSCTCTVTYTWNNTSIPQGDTATPDAESYQGTTSVTVSQATITAIANPSDVTVSAGTKQSVAESKLPATVSATVNSQQITLNLGPWSTSTSYTGLAGSKMVYTANAALPDSTNYAFATGVGTVTCNINFVSAPVITLASKDDLSSNYYFTKNQATGTTLSVAPTAVDSTNKTLSVSYQWYGGSSKGSMSKLTGATNSTYTPDVSKAGTMYYYCKITATDANGITSELNSNVARVDVSDLYKITLSVGRNDQSVTVGETPEITAVVQAYNTTTKKYTDLDSSVELTWTTAQTSKIAELDKVTTKSSRNGTASNTLNTYSIGTYASKAEVDVTASIKVDGTTYTSDKLTITVNSVTNADIPYSYSGSGVSMKEDDFYNALKTAIGTSYYKNVGIENFYVVFGNQYGGTLYESSSKTSSSYKVGSQRCYYAFGSSNRNHLDLDGVYFQNDTNYTKDRYVEYTVYTDNGKIADGVVKFNGSAVDIEYTTTANNAVNFVSSEFNTLSKNKLGKTLDYVVFDMKNATFAGYSYSSYNETKYGALYTTSKLKTEVTGSSDKYYYSPSGTQSDLDDVTYSAGSVTTQYTVIIPFTAYSTNGTSYAGNVYIYVNNGHTITILGGNFTTEKITAEVTAAFPDATYVQFTLPAAADGKLYYNYSTIASYGHTVKATNSYYLDPSKNQYGLKYVYFVPAADCASTITVKYTAYDAKDKSIGTGKITFIVVGRTYSSYYNDVTTSATGSWSANAVDFMSANKLVNGIANNKFGPYDSMTRGMLVTVLYRAAGTPSVSGISNPFTDVKSSDYYYNAVLWAYKNGVVTGNTKTTFAPKDNVTREQIAAILYRYAGSPSASATFSGYTDSGKISSYALSAMKWAVSSGYIQGAGTKLNPTNSATRAEVAVMLYRFLTK